MQRVRAGGPLQAAMSAAREGCVIDDLERLFLAASAVMDRPWPTDPWLKARARAAFAAATAARFMGEVETKLAEIVALHDAHAKAQADALELLEQVDAWADVAEKYMAVENDSTSARYLGEAMREEAAE